MQQKAYDGVSDPSVASPYTGYSCSPLTQGSEKLDHLSPNRGMHNKSLQYLSQSLTSNTTALTLKGLSIHGNVVLETGSQRHCMIIVNAAVLRKAVADHPGLQPDLSSRASSVGRTAYNYSVPRG
jgi:hypothetical protein